MIKKEEQKQELKLCPSCMKRMTWLEQIDGTAIQWCFTCQSSLLTGPLVFTPKQNKESTK